MINSKKRGQLNVSFGWLFGIIVGAIILGLAIYMSVKLIDVGQTSQDAKTGKEFGNLLNPLETGFESGKATAITFPVDTRVYNDCTEAGYFGEQVIRISQKSFNKWTDTNLEIALLSKYIFSNEVIEGKKSTIFTLPFSFPFKVANLLYIIPVEEQYCFVDAPEDIKEEISNLNMKNILVENCSDYAKTICFNKAGCDISVILSAGKVMKDDFTLEFAGNALMYGAIFSDEFVYKCQVKRLMKRVGHLSSIYRDKAVLIAKSGCNTDTKTDLLSLENAVKNFESSNIVGLDIIAKKIGEKNEYATCKLW